MVRAGLLTPHLEETAMEARAKRLNPIPTLPRPQRLIHAYAMSDAINLVASKYRPAAQWLMHNTQVVAFRELCRSVKHGIVTTSYPL